MTTWNRVSLEGDPFVAYDPRHPYEGSLPWPCHWVSSPQAGAPPFVMAYRLAFHLDAPAQFRLHVTADERYVLYLDGEQLGRGPERGDPRNWFYESYDISLPAGDHLIAARVWALGPLASHAQMSAQPGFLLCVEDPRYWDVLNTGRAPWQAARIDAYTFTPPLNAFAVGHRIVLDARRYPWGFERGEEQAVALDWQPVERLHPGYNAASRGHIFSGEHLLRPAALPAMLETPRRLGRARHVSAPGPGDTHDIPLRAEDHLSEEEGAWNDLLAGRASFVLPPHTRRRVLVDLENYYCAYPEAVVSGGGSEGGRLRIHFQEGLFAAPGNWDRGNRDVIDGKYFISMGDGQDALGDLFILDGGQQRRLEPLWWNAGRYVEILVESGDEPLTIERLTWRETRYPYENESRFSAGDPRLEQVIPLAVRALQMCSHETYMDCPYYEQLMYIGDTRLECLVTYVTSRDARLPKKALEMFAASLLPGGLTQSRYPARQRQIIPPFSLWWVAMLRDFLLWRGEEAFVRRLLPAARQVLDTFTGHLTADGLVRSPEGWNFVDWVDTWEAGVPPGGTPGGICAPLNWQYVYALAQAAAVEEAFGEHELAERDRCLARQAARALVRVFWDGGKGLFADDPERTVFSEHSQCLALLADEQCDDLLEEPVRQALAASLFSTPGLTRTSVYFSHYLFEACRLLGRVDVFFERMQPWFDMPQYGFKTTYENGNPHTNRSDCHAWGAHPLYHYFASLLGVRPAAPGFARVEIVPQPGPLERISGTLPHPAGEIAVEIRREGQSLSGQVRLPQGVSGVLRANGRRQELLPGLNIVEPPA